MKKLVIKECKNTTRKMFSEDGNFKYTLIDNPFTLKKKKNSNSIKHFELIDNENSILKNV